MNPIQECGILKVFRENLKQVLVPRFGPVMLHICVDIPAKNNRALSGKLLVATCKLPRLHVIFEYANAGFRVFELGTGNLVEKDHMFKADNAQFPVALL